MQRVQENPGKESGFRLIAYGDEGTYQPVQFGSFDELVSVLHKALPDFRSPSLGSESDSSGGSIIFVELMELGPAQLSLLGLRSRPGSTPRNNHRPLNCWMPLSVSRPVRWHSNPTLLSRPATLRAWRKPLRADGQLQRNTNPMNGHQTAKPATVKRFGDGDRVDSRL